MTLTDMEAYAVQQILESWKQGDVSNDLADFDLPYSVIEGLEKKISDNIASVMKGGQDASKLNYDEAVAEGRIAT